MKRLISVANLIFLSVMILILVIGAVGEINANTTSKVTSAAPARSLSRGPVPFHGLSVTPDTVEATEWKAGALYGGNVTELVISPNNPDVLYAVTDVGLFRSVDGGDLWTFISAAKMMHSLALFPADGNGVLEDILYASMRISDDWSLHRSDDGGVSWVDMELDPPYERAFTHPLNPEIVFVAGGWGAEEVLVSKDRGVSWESLTGDDGLTDTAVSTLIFHPEDPSTIFVGTETEPFVSNGFASIYKSIDGGVSWVPITTQPPIKRINTLVINPHGDNELWVSDACLLRDDPDTTQRTLKSDGAYSAWSVVDFDGDDSTMTMPVIAFPPSDWGEAYENTIYAHGCWGHTYQSNDGGDNWEILGDQSGGGDLVVHPSLAGVLYRSGLWHGVYIWGGSEENWHVTNEGLTALVPAQLAPVPDHPEIYFAIEEFNQGGVHRTIDGGETWAFFDVPTAEGIGLIFVDPLETTRVYVGSQDTRSGADEVYVHISEDRGETWPTRKILQMAPIEDCVTVAGPFSAHPNQPSRLLYGPGYFCFTGPQDARGRLFYSEDQGVIWQESVYDGLEGIGVVTDIVHDSQTPEVVYASTYDNLLRSQDGGQIWHAIGEGLPDFDDQRFEHRIAVEPIAPYRVYLWTGATGLYVSGDQGDTWEKVNQSLEGYQVRELLSVEEATATLYVAVEQSPEGPGIFRSDDGGGSWGRAPGSISQVAVYALAAINHEGSLYLYAGTGGGEIQAGGIESIRATDGGVRLVSPGAYTYTFGLVEEGFDLYLPLFLR